MGFHVIRVRSGTDFQVEQQLEELGIECLSLVEEREYRHRRNRAKYTRRVPYIPGYVFADVPAEEWPYVYRMRGVIGPLRNGDEDSPFARVSRSVVQCLQEQLDAARKKADPVALFKIGDHVFWTLFDRVLEGSVVAIRGDRVQIHTSVEGKRIVVDKPSQEFTAVA